jgi:chemotaxis signal transduction protein
MSVIKSLQKPESHRNNQSARRKKHVTKLVSLLKFNVGNSLYAVEMSELKKVIMDLISIQNVSSRSITTQFIKRNRGETIIFNLESCLSIQQSTKINKGNTSILIFNETIHDSQVGILVPGTPEIMKSNGLWSESVADPYDGDTLPVRGIIRNEKSLPFDADDVITLIDIRNLVENCIVRLKFYEMEGLAALAA